MAITEQDLLRNDSTENMGGTQTEIYWAIKSDILTFKKPKNLDDGTTFASLVEITEAHVFKSGKKMNRLYVTQDKNGVMDESVGERDGKSWKNKTKFFHPGTKAEVLGFARYINNESVIFWVPEADGKVRQIGSEEFPAKVETGSITTGEATENLKGISMELGCASRGPAPVYTPALQLTPAV